jgi:hypothetical protein
MIRRVVLCSPVIAGAVASSMIVLHLGGCAASEKLPPATEDTVASTAAGASNPAAILVNGRAIGWDSLKPQLAEAAGAMIVRDTVLDIVIDAELGRRALKLEPADIAAEENLLQSSLSSSADEAARLIVNLRRRDGLGPTRWAALLRRNAALRLLVRDQVTITDPMIDAAFDVAHGPRRQSRLLVAASRTELERLASRIKGGEPFGDVAATESADASASRGGLLAPIARQDPSYPAALREAMWSTPIGELSSAIMLESGYALVRPEREIPTDGAKLSAVRSALERAVRVSQERILMDQLAQRLLWETQITVLDESLHRAWMQQQ